MPRPGLRDPRIPADLRDSPIAWVTVLVVRE
jgi:hypothetical protein